MTFDDLDTWVLQFTVMFNLENLNYEESSLERMKDLKGGECTASEGFSVGLAVAGVAFAIAFPISAFLIPLVGTATGLSLGVALAECSS